ncbi:sensor protein PilS [Betaproteobacteria bacterium]|nr:sensor protein PilS [Betaproteobacteria bacterium]GHU13687.1 sensor protein PilS [Betaproteobacteria bacterium]GHU40356.1 sensor protein PilS [Betaproteobacteria bacterium]
MTANLYISPADEKAQHWRSFRLYNSYRVIQAVLLGAMPFMPWITSEFIKGADKNFILYTAGLYVALAGLGLTWSLLFRKRFYMQVTLQVIVDALCLNMILFLMGGFRSGIGGLLLVSVAGASLVAQGRLALFYAALISLSSMGMEFASHVYGIDDGERMARTGFLCVSFFATAISANLLGRRGLANAELARKRGIERDNQRQISERIMERIQDGVLVVDAEGRVQNSNLSARSILEHFNIEGTALSGVAVELALGYQNWRAGHSQGAIELVGPTGRTYTARFADAYASNGAALIFLEDLGKLRDEAQQLKLASLGRLTASIAHEIRNPLAAISHASELLMEEADSPLQNRLVHIVRDNTERLDRIIRDVLVMGRQRIVQREEPERRESIALRHYLNEFTKTILHQENLEEGVIAVNAPPEATMGFVPEQFHQVIWNLVMNALRYSTRKKSSVRLEVRLPGDGVELHVIDDGPGIPAELREQIFDPFFTTSVRGTGLGLHIARELCDANGARLLLSAEGLGGGGGHFILKERMASWQNQAQQSQGKETPEIPPIAFWS